MFDLAPLHTFAFNYRVSQLVDFHSVEDVIKAAKSQGMFAQTHYLLGGGSNTVFCQDFAGHIIRYKGNGLDITEDPNYYYLTVGAGFNWHELVKHTIENGIYGLENLALIPGLVGAAPIQNIGAYGVELCQVLDFVEFIDKSTLRLERLSNDELNLAYRDSIFKHQLAGKVLITCVGLKLSKKWQANTTYAGLQGLTTAQQIFDTVVNIRQSKLPDPNVLPNAGSFFKNPVISVELFNRLKANFADMPCFNVDDNNVKVPAAWLIDNCNLKGFSIGGVGVYEKHGLVLVNHSNGSGDELLELVAYVRRQVKQKFAINLDIEVRLVGANGLLEVDTGLQGVNT